MTECDRLLSSADMKGESSTSTTLEYPTSLHVLTLNCWGLKFISRHRRERLREIGARLAQVSPRPDIVALQECWTQEDYHSIRTQNEHYLPYSKYYWSGIFGGGLVILSRWPIEESNMYRYPLNGRPTAFFRGDWFVGKGVACARIRIGPGPRDFAEVFCTHLHAPYEREPNDSYICHRTAQAWDIAKLMRGAAERGHVVLGMGDFNMIPLSLAHQLVEGRAPVKDVWRIMYPDSSIGAAEDAPEQARQRPMPDIKYNLEKNGTTCDSGYNTWRWDKPRRKRLDNGELIIADESEHDVRGKRLDYIFFSPGSPHNSEARTWRVDDVSVGFTERHSTLHCSLSDHFSVAASFSWSNSDASNANGSTGHDKSVEMPCTGAELSPHIYDDILAMIHKYDARERWQRKARLGHFGGSLVVSIGLFTAVWWSPHNGVAFLLMLVTSLGLPAGVIDGLIGGLFIGSELRALKEFEWEIRNAQNLAKSGVS